MKEEEEEKKNKKYPLEDISVKGYIPFTSSSFAFSFLILGTVNYWQMEKEVKGNGTAEAVAPKFRLRFWEAAAASTVVLGFVLGLLSVYLTIPDSDYSFLKLPRTLEDLQVLR